MFNAILAIFVHPVYNAIEKAEGESANEKFKRTIKNGAC
jgi:hypothetical protein